MHRLVHVARSHRPVGQAILVNAPRVGGCWTRSFSTETTTSNNDTPSPPPIPPSTTPRAGIADQLSSLLQGKQKAESFVTKKEDTKDAFDPKDYYDIIFKRYPTLTPDEVNTNVLLGKKRYADWYMEQVSNAPKKVFKFTELVPKNYRTLARSWPLVRLNDFKYGKDHFVDEIYDNMPGKYH